MTSWFSDYTRFRAGFRPSHVPRYLAVLGLVALTACASDRGVAEFQVYQSTYDAASETVTAVLDEFQGTELQRARAFAERNGVSPLALNQVAPAQRAAVRQQGRNRVRANGGFDDAFHTVDSIYFATNATPPITRAFRRAWNAIGAYNDVLDAYASGRSLAELKVELSGLSEAMGALDQALTGGSSLVRSFLPLSPLSQSAGDLVQTALAARSRRDFRHSVVALQPDLQRTLATMRDAAPPMFDLMTAARREAVRDATNPADRAKNIEAIGKYREIMSNWVLALDATNRALFEVVTAIQAPPGGRSVLSDLTNATQTAAAATNQTRRLFGDIRSTF